tara:strand:- start:689 stop:898 length:210 start_codon:yes stop_codon:yes gene_type:complete
MAELKTYTVEFLKTRGLRYELEIEAESQEQADAAAEKVADAYISNNAFEGDLVDETTEVLDCYESDERR